MLLYILYTEIDLYNAMPSTSQGMTEYLQACKKPGKQTSVIIAVIQGVQMAYQMGNAFRHSIRALMGFPIRHEFQIPVLQSVYTVFWFSDYKCVCHLHTE
ncbi:unnamed protein product [Eretmochelys imbricata]